MSLAEVAVDVAASGRSHATIVGFGSLLSERSARGTCPNLTNFRVVRVNGWRRVFQHAAAIFWERGIAIAETKEMASLSAEPSIGSGFVAATFDVPQEELPALLEREEEFDFAKVPFSALEGQEQEEREYAQEQEQAGRRERQIRSGGAPLQQHFLSGEGFMCVPSTDAEVLDVRGLVSEYNPCTPPISLPLHSPGLE